MRNTIRNVTMVVLVLITSCQVSLKWKSGPLIPQTTIKVHAAANVSGRPAACAVAWANRVNSDRGLPSVMGLTQAQRARQKEVPQSVCRNNLLERPLSDG